jgi:hypothetical protein
MSSALSRTPMRSPGIACRFVRRSHPTMASRSTRRVMRSSTSSLTPARPWPPPIRRAKPYGAGPIHVRVGIHTGAPHVTDEGYIGEVVHLGARIGAAGHGGQILLSEETRRSAGLAEELLVDLGEHRLKDFENAVRILQLGSERFPPLKTISNTNLPRPASSFIGRGREVAEVVALLRDGARLVTLTGPGGSGKSRLSIEAAAELLGDHKAGTFWVELAPVRDPALVNAEIAKTLGTSDGLADYVGEREMLLVLDNLEQVIDAAPELADLVETCPNLRILVTSRERLRVRGEVEYAVEPLSKSMPSLCSSPVPASSGSTTPSVHSVERSTTCRSLSSSLRRVRKRSRRRRSSSGCRSASTY